MCTQQYELGLGTGHVISFILKEGLAKYGLQSDPQRNCIWPTKHGSLYSLPLVGFVQGCATAL